MKFCFDVKSYIFLYMVKSWFTVLVFVIQFKWKETFSDLCREANDGGVVNDPQIRDFTNARFAEGLSQCQIIDGEKECSGDKKESMYTKETIQNFTLVTYNPAFGDGLNGVQVLQQIVPMRTSKIMVLCIYLINSMMKI